MIILLTMHKNQVGYGWLIATMIQLVILSAGVSRLSLQIHKKLNAKYILYCLISLKIIHSAAYRMKISP